MKLKLRKMIYLLRGPAIKSGQFETILKIGWTEDEKATRRFKTYLSHNPTIQVLYTFSGYSKEVEEALHSKFLTHRYPGTDEWYLDCAEIINFFSKPDISLELKSLEPTERRKNIEWNKKKIILSYILHLLVPASFNSFDILPEEGEEDYVKLVKAWYGEDIAKEFIIKLKSFEIMYPEAKKVILEIASLKTISAKVKRLWEIEEEEVLDIIFDGPWIEPELENEYNKWNRQ